MASATSTSAPLPLLPHPASTCRLVRHLPVSLYYLPPRRLALAPTRPNVGLFSGVSDAPEQEQEEPEEGEELVEVGYVSGAHGVRGDVLVTPRTDFPHLRFATPGKRWLRARAAGKQQVKELELVQGRAHPGRKSWIVSFDGVSNLDEARKIVGSAILIKAGDRPTMEDNEFYSLDLVGMRVVLKDTGKLVGTVAHVFNFGAGDLLHVTVGSAEGSVLQPSPENQGSTSSGEHVWIPFAEDIVPDIDVERREMWITPPKGLLELNSRSDMRSKKERRMLEWKEKKKLQRRITAAKKILSEMNQSHVLEGLQSRDKFQKDSYAKQIGSIDFQFFRHAMLGVSRQINSSSYHLVDNSSLSRKNVIRIPYKTFMSLEDKEKHIFSGELKKGLEIIRKSKIAIVLVINGSESDLVDAELERLLSSFNDLMKVEDNCVTVPLIIVSPAVQVESIRKFLVENEYFDFDGQKVWVLEEMELPIVSISSELNSKKILLKSPWEILQRPAGSGATFSLLSSNKILDTLNEMDVEYVQICSLSNRSIIGHPLLFGAVNFHGADVGIKLCNTSKTGDDFDMILSMNQLNRFSRDVTKLRFSAHPEQHVHVEHVDGQWITALPEAANSYRLHADVTSVLNYCSPDKVCVMKVVE